MDKRRKLLKGQQLSLIDEAIKKTRANISGIVPAVQMESTSLRGNPGVRLSQIYLGGY